MFLSAVATTSWSLLSVNCVSIYTSYFSSSLFYRCVCVSIETEHNVTVYGIHANFSLRPKVFQEIHDILHDLEVGILGEWRL